MIRIEAIQLQRLAAETLRRLDVVDTVQVMDVRELTDGMWMVAFEDRAPYTRFPGFEIGIQQTNIMVGVPGTDYVGPLPGFLNKPCPSSVGVLTASKQQDAARAMIKFMISPEAAPLLRKTRVEPAKP